MDFRSARLLVLGLALPALCAAQTPAFNIPSFAAMQRDSVQSVDITLGPLALGLARFLSQFAEQHDPDGAAAMNVLRGVRTVQVHSFQFATDHTYKQADLEALRSQLTSPGWHQMVQVRNNGTSENVDIYCALDNHMVTGLVIIAAEPREFTLVNIVGRMDPDQIAKLRRSFVPGGRGRPALGAY